MSPNPVPIEQIRASLLTLLDETFEKGAVAYLDRGGSLFETLESINAEAASRRIAVKMGALTHLEDLSPSDIAAGHRRVYRLDTLCRDALAAGLKVGESGGIFFKPLANFQLDALIGGPLISEAFMEGCYLLGKEQPAMAASIYVIAERQA